MNRETEDDPEEISVMPLPAGNTQGANTAAGCTHGHHCSGQPVTSCPRGHLALCNGELAAEPLRSIFSWLLQ